jgi:hypothetical protein
MSEIYGIAGAKQHGKDTLANYIKQYNDKFEIVHFADELKRLVCIIFDLELAQLNEPFLKEKLFNNPVVMDKFLDLMKSETGLDIKPQNKIANTPREVMQFFGTEYVRSEQDDYWIDFVKRKIENSTEKNFLISDVRYPNEANVLRQLGGKIIKVIRIDMSQNPDSHASERPDLIDADLTLGFITDNFSLHKVVSLLIARNMFEKTLCYDHDAYRLLNDYYNYRLYLLNNIKNNGVDCDDLLFNAIGIRK